MEEEDRISKSPDAILQRILSSIDLKHAVQTSILSKRWGTLWSPMPNLDFNFCRLAVLAMDTDLLEQSPSPFPNIKHLILTKRSNIIHPVKNVPRTVMDCLTKGSLHGDSLVVEFPKGHSF